MGWFSKDESKPKVKEAWQDYSIHEFQKDFPQLMISLEKTIVELPDPKQPDQASILSLLTAAMVINYQRLLLNERLNRHIRRNLLKGGLLEEFEKMVVEGDQRCENLLQKDLETVSLFFGIPLDRLKHNMQHQAQTDPEYPKRIEKIWKETHTLPKEVQKYNPKNLTETQLVEAFKYMSTLAESFTFQPKDSYYYIMIKSLYLSDKLASEKGIEPEDLVLDPKNTPHRVAMALTVFKQKLNNPPLIIR